MVVRRLPPGLTQAEFESALGEDWKIGAGKVDWSVYKAGKISKEYSSHCEGFYNHLAHEPGSLAKPSRPARAYLHLTEQAYLAVLKDAVLETQFTDSKNTAKDPSLVGPPSLEFAPYNRIPVGRKRNDPRQGTIDQDPEFIEFLQSLTNPIQKPATVDAEAGSKREEIKTTPLIEHIREKKAAKEKPAAAKAAAKHGRLESKDSKASDKAEKKVGAKVAKEVAATPEKGKRSSRAEKAAKEAVKVLNREAPAGAPTAEKSTAPAAAIAERRRERAANPISVAAKIQRDLGLGPAGGRRARREQAADAPQSSTESPTTAPAAAAAQVNASSLKKDPKASRGRRTSKSAEKTSTDASPETSKKIPTGPAQPTILQKPAGASQSYPPKGPAARAIQVAPKGDGIPTGPASATSEPSTPNTPTTPASTGRQAFLKHANPSQGITEPLIEEALKVFGAIEKVEIDRKKGFAYVDFAEAESMRKAIAGSPVKVAQGAVQVLERRDRVVGRAPVAPMALPRGGFRGRGGRGRGGRGGMGAPASPSVASSSAPAGASAAPSAPSASSAT